MSELINARDNRATIRWKLLTGASALALTAYVSSGSLARAEDSNHPVLWLELGGQFDSLTDPSEIWVPGNLPPVIDHPVAPVAKQTPRIGYDMNGAITLQLPGSDWNLSAAIQYGKAKKGPKFAHDQTYQTHFNGHKYVPTTYAFTDMHAVEETKHVILDFSAGRDVGLGLFGGHGHSTVNLGVRVAQFRERTDGHMTAQVSVPVKYAGLYVEGKTLDSYLRSSRSFEGLGPSIAWSGSVPIAGSPEDGLAIDWGANAALLFGRQKAKAQTHTHKSEIVGVTFASSVPGLGNFYQPIFAQLSNVTEPNVRSKNVTVPNLGGLVGLSFRKGDAKISFGYKADFFFGAIDGGIATAKKENRGFYGPFASISIGIGD
jgi:hypothetical protein